MKAGSRLLGSIVVIAALGAPAIAQPSAAAATAQFDKGRALMKRKQYAEACAAFEQSQKLDPQWGTLYNLAGCYQASGKLASAWATYRELAQRDSNAGRKKDAGKKARALDKRLPHLLVRIPDAPAGLAVTLDGNDITGLVGTESPIDLGDHKLHASAPRFRDLDAAIQITAEGKTISTDVALEPIHGVPEPVARTAPPAGATQVTATAAPITAAPTDVQPRSHRRAIGVVVAGGGVALVATGLVFGRLADSKWSDAKKLCGDDRMCDSSGDLAAGNKLVSDARSRATLSTVFAIGGGVAIAAGAVLFLTAPRGSASTTSALRVSPAATTDSVSLQLGGRF